MKPPQKMGPSEALVETLAANGVTHVFGIVGSAFMDALDIFPAAGIRFVPVAHEQGAIHMADGYARASGRHGVCIAQNGPGVTNFVTGVAAAYWAHSPVVFITPETGSMTMGLGGFQETEQLPIFSKITKYQGHVNNPKRMAEIAARCFDRAMLEMGPAQLNIPRDFFYGEIEATIAEPLRIGQGAGDAAALERAAALLAGASFPVIVAGGGVINAGCHGRGDRAGGAARGGGVQQLPAQRLLPRLACARRRAAGLPGLEGRHEAHRPGGRGARPRHAPRALRHAAAARSRLLAETGEDHPDRYRPAHARARQADLGRHPWRCARGRRRAHRRLKGRPLAGAAKPRRAPQRASPPRKPPGKRELSALDARARSLLARGRRQTRSTCTRARCCGSSSRRCRRDSMVSTDIGNICSVANSYLRFEKPRSMFAAMSFGNCGYAFPVICGAKIAAPERPAFAYVGDGAWGISFNELLTCARERIGVTVVVFNNGQWGAEKKNHVDFYSRRYQGVNLENPSWAGGGARLRLRGRDRRAARRRRPALRAAAQAQSDGKTTVLEMMVTQELGDPFRRDALSKPVRYLEKYRYT